MLPDNLRENPVAAALEEFDAGALMGGKHERGELTLEIVPARIATVCGFLKRDHRFIRLSTVTAVDRYPAEPALRGGLSPALHRGRPAACA